MPRIKKPRLKNRWKTNAAPKTVSTTPHSFGFPENRFTRISSALSGVTPERIICAVLHESSAANSHIPIKPKTKSGALVRIAI